MSYEPSRPRAAASNVYDLFSSTRSKQDRAFDLLLPDDLRVRSALHFTPRHVAVRAAEWIDEFSIRTVVDIGSGAGKFCVAAALAGRAEYIGLEQRERLVKASRKLALHFDLASRVRFVHGMLGTSVLPSAEAYYMYNPFGENLFGPESQIDGDVEPSLERYQRDVKRAEQVLAELPSGTFLITYNGFGGQVPHSFRQVRAARDLPNALEMWKKSP